MKGRTDEIQRVTAMCATTIMGGMTTRVHHSSHEKRELGMRTLLLPWRKYHSWTTRAWAGRQAMMRMLTKHAPPYPNTSHHPPVIAALQLCRWVGPRLPGPAPKNEEFEAMLPQSLLSQIVGRLRRRAIDERGAGLRGRRALAIVARLLQCFGEPVHTELIQLRCCMVPRPHRALLL